MLDARRFLPPFYIAISAGILKCIGQLQYTYFPVKGAWYKWECLSDNLFNFSILMFGVVIAQIVTDDNLKLHKARIWVSTMLVLSIGDTLDQFLFKPVGFDSGEKMFVMITAYIHLSRLMPKYFNPANWIVLNILSIFTFRAISKPVPFKIFVETYNIPERKK